MAPYFAPLEALRRDAERRPDSPALASEAAAWLALAHQLRHARREATRPESRAASAEDVDVEATLDAAARMEDVGALHLAATVLSHLLTVAAGEPALTRGRILARWARVERQLGELDVAADLYADAGRLGRADRRPELEARAEIGLAVIARMRGNYPEARLRFRRALKRAEAAELPELIWQALQGLMITAAVARDFDAALNHGWAAFAHAAGNPGREADVLANLGTLCLDASQDAAALAAFLAAAARTTVARTALHAKAGAAHAAARLGRRELLERLTSEVERAAAAWEVPYAVAQWLVTLAEAWRDAGDLDRANAFRIRGLEVARARGFTEIEHQFEAPMVAQVAKRSAAPPLAATARRVVRDLQRLPVIGPA